MMGFVFVPNIILFLLALSKNLGTAYNRNICRCYVLTNLIDRNANINPLLKKKENISCNITF